MKIELISLCVSLDFSLTPYIERSWAKFTKGYTGVCFGGFRHFVFLSRKKAKRRAWSGRAYVLCYDDWHFRSIEAVPTVVLLRNDEFLAFANGVGAWKSVAVGVVEFLPEFLMSHLLGGDV